MHWADEIADKIIQKYPNLDNYVCASGITPSGTVHVGNLRDVLTSEMVVRALQEKGKNAELIWSWDDYDKLRKIPKNIPQEWEKYLGLPISSVPDFEGKEDSYAKHFEKEFEKAIPILGIKARIIRQSEKYQKNDYFDLIKTALQKRKEIAAILYRYKAQDAQEEDIENYYPLNIYCTKCGLESGVITAYDGENSVTYKCKCSHEETVDISKQNIGKLSWRVDWPMRWKYENVVFEPGGRDHSSAGGSYEVSSVIAKEVFGIEPPIYQGYEFIGLTGTVSKMSSSQGVLFTPEELLEIYESEIVRWFYARVNPLQKFDFALDDQIIKTYSEWDVFLNKFQNNELDEKEKRILDFCKVKEEYPKPGSVSFRQLASFAQIAQGNKDILREMIEKSGGQISENDFQDRLPRAIAWAKKYAPEDYRVNLRDEKNTDFYENLSDEWKAKIKRLTNSLDENWSADGLTNLIYEIPKEGTPEENFRDKQKEFFEILYQLLTDKTKGPRLATFLMAIGIEKAKYLLIF